MSERPDSPPRMDARALTRTRRDALRARTRRIRHAVAGVTATLFVLVFAVVYVQLASGHDPALVANARKHATGVHSESSAAKGSSTATGAAGTAEATDTTEATGATEATSTGPTESTDSTGSSSGEESSATAVTTSQS
jgi:hypothetical protein